MAGVATEDFDGKRLIAYIIIIVMIITHDSKYHIILNITLLILNIICMI